MNRVAELQDYLEGALNLNGESRQEHLEALKKCELFQAADDDGDDDGATTNPTMTTTVAVAVAVAATNPMTMTTAAAAAAMTTNLTTTTTTTTNIIVSRPAGAAEFESATGGGRINTRPHVPYVQHVWIGPSRRLCAVETSAFTFSCSFLFTCDHILMFACYATCTENMWITRT